MNQRETLYDVLGVASDASLDEIRRAFRRLTREHHPDRFRDGARAAAERRFQAITEAFNVLGRVEARQRYDRELEQAGGGARTLSSGEVARRLVLRAAAHLKEGRLQEAEQDLRGALDHEAENGRALHLLALVMARTQRERQALRLLEQAATVDPSDVASRAEAAAIALAQGLALRARRLAEDALAVDPSNARALEVLDRVEAEAAAGSSDGLLDRLRRKG